jgi:hypothetical protein
VTKPKKTREAKPGELREINVLQRLESLSRRTESRIDVQRMLESLSPISQTYVKHLVTSGPSSLLSAAKATGHTVKEIEESLNEIEQQISRLRS